MRTARRDFLHTVVASAPTLMLMKEAGYSHDEAARMILEQGNNAGVSRQDLSTPCLLLDLDLFEANIEKMSRHSRSHSIGLRPHAKTHKCVEIARRQVQAGARGVCVATMAEAEAMAKGGIPGLLITAEVVGRPKIERLLRLLKTQPDVMIVVDNPENVRELQRAASTAGTRFRVMIDLDVGSNRTGVLPGEPALRLAEEIARSKNLDMKGICAYAGHCAHVVGFSERKKSSVEAMGRAIETRDLLRKHGHNVEIVSGGSTGTYNIDSGIEGVSELQVGSYVFMDVDYRRIGGEGGEVYDDFAPALTVLCTVIHRSANKAILDGGFKAFATDRKFGPEPKDLPGVQYAFNGDEHGALRFENPGRDIKLGDRVELIIPHCDPNVNLYDRMYGLRGDKVESVWSVLDRARGVPYF